MSVPKIPLKVLKVASVNPSSPLDSWLEPTDIIPLGRLPFRQVSSNLGLVTSGLLTRVDLPWFPGQSRERSSAQSQDTGDFSKNRREGKFPGGVKAEGAWGGVGFSNHQPAFPPSPHLPSASESIHFESNLITEI